MLEKGLDLVITEPKDIESIFIELFAQRGIAVAVRTALEKLLPSLACGILKEVH
jgi:hypothetical protein